MLLTERAIPHTDFVKAMLLAGMPILDDTEHLPSIRTVLHQYGFNIHTVKEYERIRDKMKKDSLYGEIMGRNQKVADENKAISNIESRKHLYVGDKGTPLLFSRNITIDLMHLCSQIQWSPCDATRRMLKILNIYDARLFVEVMMLHDLSFTKIAGSIPYGSFGKEDVTHNDIRAYCHYFWKFGRMCGKDEYYDMIPMANYISMDPNNGTYRQHRAQIFAPYEEILLYYGIVDKDRRQRTNNHIYGMAAADIMNKMKSGKPVTDHVIKLFNSINRAMGDEDISRTYDEIRARLEETFAKVDKTVENRQSVSDLRIKYEKGEIEEQEQDELAFPTGTKVK